MKDVQCYEPFGGIVLKKIVNLSQNKCRVDSLHSSICYKFHYFADKMFFEKNGKVNMVVAWWEEHLVDVWLRVYQPFGASLYKDMTELCLQRKIGI